MCWYHLQWNQTNTYKILCLSANHNMLLYGTVSWFLPVWLVCCSSLYKSPLMNSPQKSENGQAVKQSENKIGEVYWSDDTHFILHNMNKNCMKPFETFLRFEDIFSIKSKYCRGVLLTIKTWLITFTSVVPDLNSGFSEKSHCPMACFHIFFHCCLFSDRYVRQQSPWTLVLCKSNTKYIYCVCKNLLL